MKKAEIKRRTIHLFIPHSCGSSPCSVHWTNITVSFLCSDNGPRESFEGGRRRLLWVLPDSSRNGCRMFIQRRSCGRRPESHRIRSRWNQTQWTPCQWEKPTGLVKSRSLRRFANSAVLLAASEETLRMSVLGRWSWIGIVKTTMYWNCRNIVEIRFTRNVTTAFK